MEQGFPGQHTTTTTTTSSMTTHEAQVRFDRSYLKQLPGILKAVRMCLDLLGWIIVSVSLFAPVGSGAWFIFVSAGGFWITGILLLFYLFHLIEKLHKIPWVKIELYFCGLWTLLYLIAASIAASLADNGNMCAGAIFGFFSMAIYAVDTYLKYRLFKSGSPAQGQFEVTRHVSTVTSDQAY